MKASRGFFQGFLTFTFLFSIESHAYITPAPYLLQTIAKKRAGLKTFIFKSKVSAIQSDGKPGAVFLARNSIDLVRHTIRIRLMDESGREFFSTEKQFNAPTQREAGRDLSFISDVLLVDNDPAVLRQVLVDAGVPIQAQAGVTVEPIKDEMIRNPSEAEYLGRWSGAVYWVVGHKARAQWWIEKDTFLPQRLVLPASNTNTLGLSETKVGAIEYRLSQYRYPKEIPFPRQVEIYLRPELGSESGERLVMREEISEMEINTPLTDLRQPVRSSGSLDSQSAVSSNVRASVQAYLSLLR